MVIYLYHTESKCVFVIFWLIEDDNDYTKDMRQKSDDDTDDSQGAMVWIILAILGGGFLFFLYNTWRCHQKKLHDQEELDEEDDDGNTKIEI